MAKRTAVKPVANRIKWTPHARARFLETLRATANVTKSAAAINVSRSSIYEHREADEAFASEWDDAVEEATDALETEARRRALDGWDEPVWWQGMECGVVRKYSDRLLETMLRANRAKYRASSVELSGPNGGPLQVSNFADLAKSARK
jgi:hypothetical protein